MNNWEEILKIEVKEFNREELQSLVSLYQFINPEITQLSEDKKLLLDKKAEEILKNHRRKKYTKKIMLQGITIYEYPKSYMIFFDSS